MYYIYFYEGRTLGLSGEGSYRKLCIFILVVTVTLIFFPMLLIPFFLTFCYLSFLNDILCLPLIYTTISGLTLLSPFSLSSRIFLVVFVLLYRYISVNMFFFSPWPPPCILVLALQLSMWDLSISLLFPDIFRSTELTLQSVPQQEHMRTVFWSFSRFKTDFLGPWSLKCSLFILKFLENAAPLFPCFVCYF